MSSTTDSDSPFEREVVNLATAKRIYDKNPLHACWALSRVQLAICVALDPKFPCGPEPNALNHVVNPEYVATRSYSSEETRQALSPSPYLTSPSWPETRDD